MTNDELSADLEISTSTRWQARYVSLRGQRVACLGYGFAELEAFKDDVRNAGGSLFDTDTKTFLVERRNMG